MTQSFRKRASAAYGYALARLALNDYTYFEDDPGEDGPVSLQEAGNAFQQLLAAWLDGETPVEALRQLRDRIVEEMEIVTSFADCFRVYEYALNRMERRFETGLPVSDVSDEEFFRQLMHFIRGDGDAALMHQRVQMVMGQLPVRLTRQKFYSMVMDGLSVLVGKDRSGLAQAMYLLRTAATVYLTPEQRNRYPELETALGQLRQLSFKELDREQYRQAMLQIGEASELLYALSEGWQAIQEMCNDLLVLCLTRDAAVRDVKTEQPALDLLRGLYGKLQRGEMETMEDAMTDLLYELEGVQEEYIERYQRLAPAAAYRDGEDETERAARWVDLLMSSSPFARMEDLELTGEASQAEVQEEADRLFADLEQLFSESQRPVTRAVMAAILSNLPICFQSMEEIENYIRGSLFGCTDPAEKETCVELLQQLMEFETYGMV